MRRAWYPSAALLAALCVAAGAPTSAIAHPTANGGKAQRARKPALTLRNAVRVHGHYYALAGGRPLYVRARYRRYIGGRHAHVVLKRRGGAIARRAAKVHHVGDDGLVRYRHKIAHPGPVNVIIDSSRVHVTVLRPRAHPGASGARVGVLQALLAREHYAVPRSGHYDAATARAVLTFHKVNHEPLSTAAGQRTFRLLARGKGAFHARYPTRARHVEVDLARRVIALVDHKGHVHRVYTTSPGKPSTPTVEGHFHFYRKDPGYNSELMYYSSYFIRGYAVHGYHYVPPGYSASHGCVRIPLEDAHSVYDWIRIGMRIDVYH